LKRRKVREVVRRLISKTLEILEEDPELAEKLAKLARRIRLKARIKQPYELKILFCKKCKSFAPPPIYSKIRIRKGWLIITCLKCGGIYRKRVKFKTSVDKQN